jgi:hypothetical protein
MTMPFITFFAARTFLDSPRKVRIVLFALIAGYVIPIVGSSFMIFSDASIKEIDYYSEVERQTGLYRGTHTLAHSMSFFSVLFAFFLQNKPNIPRLRRYIVYITFVLSVYCFWNSYTRSVYLGFVIFWMFYFFQWRKRYFIVGFMSLLLFVLWKLPTLSNIFLKSSEFNVDGASSGRLTLWLHNLKLFLEWPFYYKLLGSGFGSEAETVMGGEYDVWSSHNDWISLLMTTGVIGLLLYVGIVFVLSRDIFRSNLERHTKALYISCLIMFISLSSFTNGYIGRFEMSQTFWLFMGCFYCIRAAGPENEK